MKHPFHLPRRIAATYIYATCIYMCASSYRLVGSMTTRLSIVPFVSRGDRGTSGRRVMDTESVLISQGLSRDIVLFVRSASVW